MSLINNPKNIPEIGDVIKNVTYKLCEDGSGFGTLWLEFESGKKVWMSTKDKSKRTGQYLSKEERNEESTPITEKEKDTLGEVNGSKNYLHLHIVIQDDNNKRVIISDPAWGDEYPESVDTATEHVRQAFLELENLNNDLVNSIIQPYRYMFLTGSPKRAVEFVRVIEQLVGLVDHPELSRPVTQILIRHGIKFEERNV